MPLCPYCGHKVIEGDDTCPDCHHSLADLPTPASEVERSLMSDRVGELAPKAPLTVVGNTPVGDVLAEMVAKSVGCMLIVEDGELLGIFTERDALMKLGPEFDAHRDRPVSEFMTRSPQTLEDSAMVAFAVQRMDLGGYRHLPVHDAQGATTGVISVRDILRYLTKRM